MTQIPRSHYQPYRGDWRGTLTYRDYSEPKRMVTLPTRLLIALSAPKELVLHYVFDDGPSKTVHSYEKMSFNFVGKELTWASGQEANAVTLSARTLTLGEDEVNPAGIASFRNKYEFSRPGT